MDISRGESPRVGGHTGCPTRKAKSWDYCRLYVTITTYGVLGGALRHNHYVRSVGGGALRHNHYVRSVGGALRHNHYVRSVGGALRHNHYVRSVGGAQSGCCSLPLVKGCIPDIYIAIVNTVVGTLLHVVVGTHLDIVVGVLLNTVVGTVLDIVVGTHLHDVGRRDAHRVDTATNHPQPAGERRDGRAPHRLQHVR